MNERHTYTQKELNELITNVAAFHLSFDVVAQKLSDAQFQSIQIRHIDLYSTEIRNSDFTNCSFAYCSFDHVVFVNCKFTQSAFYMSRINSSNFRCCEFSQCDFKLSYMSCTTLSTDCRITKCTACNSKFEYNPMTLEQYKNLRTIRCDKTRTQHDTEYTFGKILTKSIIGYKKAIIRPFMTLQEALITLEIPVGAIVFQPNNFKCRTNIAKVIRITNLGETDILKEAQSWFDSSFIYYAGETIICDDFKLNNSIECASGIHFFLDKESALNYNFS